MILRTMYNKSIIFAFFSRLDKWKSNQIQKLSLICEQSYLRKLLSKSWRMSRVALKNSFLGRATDIEKKQETEYFETSRSMKCSLDMYNTSINRVISWLRMSGLMNLANNFGQEFFSSPLRNIGIVLSVSIIANSALCFVLQKEVSLFNWFLRGSFLLTALISLSSSANWKDVKESSVVLKFLIRG